MKNISKFKKKIFCILGPTGIGKSNISMELSNIFPFRIISVDSASIYKYMNIGTAKPSINELLIYPHKLIDILDPKESYSVFNFIKDFKNSINDIYHIDKKIPLLVGGTMMYYNILFNGLNILPKSNFLIREKIQNLFSIYGCKYVHNILSNIDYEYSKVVHFNDRYRIIRAIEVFLISGKKISYLKKKKKKKIDLDIYKFILLPLNKNFLIKNIEKRFYLMLFNGFEEEVYYLYNRGDLNINMSSIKCIGYKQMWLYLDNKIDYTTMINSSIKDTILLVKHQLTWLRKFSSNSYVIEFDNYKNCINKIYNLIKFLI